MRVRRELKASPSLHRWTLSFANYRIRANTHLVSYTYHVVNFIAVVPVLILFVWNLKIPPIVQIFLWILSHNKIMTRDNLCKLQLHKPEHRLFCSEN
jgi:hypothetical protein